MAYRYLDEMVPQNAGIFNQYLPNVSPFREPMYATASDKDTVVVQQPRRRTNKKKNNKSKSKPKNDGIIRNHDSVWNYKIQDGKLLTKRKNSTGAWIDITNNEEARTEIEKFTGKSIGRTSNSTGVTPKANTPTTAQTATSQPARQQASNQQVTTPTSQARQQTVARQDSTRRDTTQMVQQPTDNDYVEGAYELPGITVTATVGKQNTNKPSKPLLSQDDLDANGWKWNDRVAGINDYGPLFEDAYNRTVEGEKILTDYQGRIIPKSEVHRYINRGRIPLYLSDYDAQFYQPQSENNTLKDIRKAQDVRRNQAFDRERNGYLATMFGLPALIGAGVTAPLATIGALAGSTGGIALFDYLAAKNGRESWREWAAAGNDPTGQFYGDFINPVGMLGGMLGGYAGTALQPAANKAVMPIVNGIKGYYNNRFGAIPGAGTKLYPSLSAVEENEGTMALANAMLEALNPTQPRTLRGGIGSRRLAKAMNQSLTDTELAQREQQMLAGDVPYLFDPEMTSSGNYLPLNPAMPAEYMGPYGIPNHVNGIPFGTPVPRVLGQLPEAGPALVTRNTGAPAPDAFAYYGAPYQRGVTPRSIATESPRPVVKQAAKKQYPKGKGKSKNKKKK